MGKTTILKEIVAALGVRAGGFYTQEERHEGKREGFRLVTLDGQTATLASIHHRSPHRVSKYGVSMENLDRVGVAALRRAIDEGDLIVVDEVGKMELFSPEFQRAVQDAIESGRPVLGTIMLGPHPWADKLKQDSRVRVFPLTESNRSQVSNEVLEALRAVISPAS